MGDDAVLHGRPVRTWAAGPRAATRYWQGGIRPGEPAHRHRCCGGAHQLQGARQAWARCRDPRSAPRRPALA